MATTEAGSRSRGRRRQGIFWMLTIPHRAFTPFLPSACSWIRGQLEEGLQPDTGDSGYLHWQIICAFQRKQSLQSTREIFGPFHAELTKSDAASDYVWKELTRIDGTQFELGAKPILMSSKPDWESIWAKAKEGNIDAIPAHVRVVSYRTLRAIGADYALPTGLEKTVRVYWGITGSGKSHRAWFEAGIDAFPKDPRTKFWNGYQGQKNVVIDEFRGGIDIAHVLRWFDKYPLHVETKGSSRPLETTSFWLTSNLDPRCWYPDADQMTVDALFRRFQVEEFTEAYLP